MWNRNSEIIASYNLIVRSVWLYTLNITWFTNNQSSLVHKWECIDFKTNLKRLYFEFLSFLSSQRAKKTMSQWQIELAFARPVSYLTASLVIYLRCKVDGRENTSIQIGMKFWSCGFCKDFHQVKWSSLKMRIFRPVKKSASKLINCALQKHHAPKPKTPVKKKRRKKKHNAKKYIILQLFFLIKKNLILTSQ